MTGVHPRRRDPVGADRDDPRDLDGVPVRDLPRDRPAWQAFREVRGWRGGIGRPAQRVRLCTADGVDLHALSVAGPGPGPAVVLLHGFAARATKPAYARLADHLAARADVLSVDLRGHGRSAGASSLGDTETEDVRAAVRWCRDRGHERVVLLGVSMGATSSLLAVGRGVSVDAVVTVSAPAVFEDEPRSVAMQTLRDVWHSPRRRWAMDVVGGVTVVPPEAWNRPEDPVDHAAKVDVPLLVVHGVDDHYFPAADAVRIAEAAPDATLWLEPAGFGHAEDGLDHRTCRRLAHAVATWDRTGRFPA